MSLFTLCSNLSCYKWDQKLFLSSLNLTNTTTFLFALIIVFVLLFLEKFSLHTFNFQCQGTPMSSEVRVTLWLPESFRNDRFHKSITPLVYKWWELASFSRPKLWFPVQNILKQSPLSSPAIAGTYPHSVYLRGDSHCAELYQKIQKIHHLISKVWIYPIIIH